MRYLLIVPIPTYVGPDGALWLDQLWHRDFQRHLEYLPDITLVSPRVAWSDVEGLCRVVVPRGATLTFVGLPSDRNVWQALLHFPIVYWRLARAIWRSEIVHSGVVGWPYPLGLVANPLAVLFRKKLVIVVESAPWRIFDSQTGSRLRRWLAPVVERFARWSANKADLAIFTSTQYRDSLMTAGRGVAVVDPATWISASDMIAPSDAQSDWDSKSERGPSILFAGRLEEEKGVSLLLETLLWLEQHSSRSFNIDLVGSGSLEAKCREAARLHSKIRVRLIAPVPYGARFFDLLRNYHAVVVPSLSDEQPRIVFDAFSQAVPVVAASTAGLRNYVLDGETGYLFARGEKTAFVASLEKCIEDPEALQEMGLRARRHAENFTHEAMHGRRARHLAALMGIRQESRILRKAYRRRHSPGPSGQ